MKNVHVLPTNKPSRLYYSGNNTDLLLSKEPISFKTFERSPQNIYITSNEEIKEGDWILFPSTDGETYFDFRESVPKKAKCNYASNKFVFKIILTTDQNLIKDGVQAIDDDFLEWFIKNPSCEEVEIERMFNVVQFTSREYIYKIIIPKEEPKQERSYSEEDVKSAFKIGFSIGYGSDVHAIDEKNRTCEEWFEQFKKK